MTEPVLIGWKEIAEFFKISVKSAQRRKNRFVEAGVIYYQARGPNNRKTVHAFPAMLMAYTQQLAQRQEMF